MARYQFTGRIQLASSGVGGWTREELGRGYEVSLSFRECEMSRDHMIDQMMGANSGMPVVTVTIDMPEAVAGAEAREALEAIEMMQAATEAGE
jgi:hypothetical protein